MMYIEPKGPGFYCQWRERRINSEILEINLIIANNVTIRCFMYSNMPNKETRWEYKEDYSLRVWLDSNLNHKVYKRDLKVLGINGNKIHNKHMCNVTGDEWNLHLSNIEQNFHLHLSKGGRGRYM